MSWRVRRRERCARGWHERSCGVVRSAGSEGLRLRRGATRCRSSRRRGGTCRARARSYSKRSSCSRTGHTLKTSSTSRRGRSQPATRIPHSPRCCSLTAVEMLGDASGTWAAKGATGSCWATCLCSSFARACSSRPGSTPAPRSASAILRSACRGRAVEGAMRTIRTTTSSAATRSS